LEGRFDSGSRSGASENFKRPHNFDLKRSISLLPCKSNIRKLYTQTTYRIFKTYEFYSDGSLSRHNGLDKISFDVLDPSALNEFLHERLLGMPNKILLLLISLKEMKDGAIGGVPSQAVVDNTRLRLCRLGTLLVEVFHLV
jgi:hypothetical protein